METIVFKNVNFSYPGRAERALSEISLTINESEFFFFC